MIYTAHRERLLMWSSISCINPCRNSRRRLTVVRACVREYVHALALMLPTAFRQMSEHYLSSLKVVTSLCSQKSNWPNLFLFHKKKQTKSHFQTKPSPLFLLRSLVLPDESMRIMSNGSQNARKNKRLLFQSIAVAVLIYFQSRN